MNLAGNILELLYEHDCVIIPGIGALVANYQPAEINYTSRSIYPPAKSLIFNRDLRYNDGLLTAYLARKEKIDYGDAKKAIEKLVKEIKSTLFTGSKYLLDDLGYFYTDSKQLIQFQPELSANLMLESYGLSFVRYLGEVSPMPARKLRMQGDARGGSPDRAVIRKWVYAAVAASVLTAAVIIAFRSGSMNNGNFNISSVNPFKKDSTELVTGDNPVRTVSTDEQKDVADIVPEVSRYHIIVGSYEDFANAREQIRIMRDSGYEARLLFTGSNKYRVSVFSSADRQESETQLTAVRSELNDKAWLYSE